jgi:cobalt-zinc-cadmium efflux system membrane fusion protein
MNRLFRLLVSAVVAGLLLPGCGGPQESGTTAEQDATVDEAEHRDLHLTPDQREEWGIEVGDVALTSISSEIVLTGVVALNQNRTAQITSYVQGKVEEVLADLGRRVRPGDALLRINSSEFARAKSSFVNANALLILSRRESERAEALLEQKAIEEKEYLRRQAEYEQRVTEFGSAESILHSYGVRQEQIDELIRFGSAAWLQEEFHIDSPYLEVRSPIAGTVIFRDVVTGEQVETDRTLFTVSDLGTLWAQLDAYETDLPFIGNDSEVVITSALYPDLEIPGRIANIGETVDEHLRTVPVRVELPNRKGILKPNMFIRGFIRNTDPTIQAIAVPEEAILLIDGESVVFVREEEDEEAGEEDEPHEVYAVRHIQTGRKVGGMRIIAAGLARGEQIVLKGAFTLKAELMKGSAADTHVH